jgi:hypothetical protein
MNRGLGGRPNLYLWSFARHFFTIDRNESANEVAPENTLSGVDGAAAGV